MIGAFVPFYFEEVGGVITVGIEKISFEMSPEDEITFVIDDVEDIYFQVNEEEEINFGVEI